MVQIHTHILPTRASRPRFRAHGPCQEQQAQEGPRALPGGGDLCRSEGPPGPPSQQPRLAGHEPQRSAGWFRSAGHPVGRTEARGLGGADGGEGKLPLGTQLATEAAGGGHVCLRGRHGCRLLRPLPSPSQPATDGMSHGVPSSPPCQGRGLAPLAPPPLLLAPGGPAVWLWRAMHGVPVPS